MATNDRVPKATAKLGNRRSRGAAPMGPPEQVAFKEPVPGTVEMAISLAGYRQLKGRLEIKMEGLKVSEQEFAVKFVHSNDPAHAEASRRFAAERMVLSEVLVELERVVNVRKYRFAE